METDLSDHINSTIEQIGHQPSDSVWYAVFFLTLLFVGVSAMLSGVEIAFFSLRSSELEHLKKSDRKAHRIILKLLQQPEWLLSSILIASLFVNTCITVLVFYLTENSLIGDWMQGYKMLMQVGLVFLILMWICEIGPKVFATHHDLRFAELTAPLMLGVMKMTFPLSYILVKSSDLISRRISFKSSGITLNELSHALDLSTDDLHDENEILEGIVKFGNIYVQEIMTPRVNVIYIEIESDFDKVLDVIIGSGYSRIPVIEEGPDNVKGILYVKDLLSYMKKDSDFNWQQVIRPAYYVPETKKINDLLTEFKMNKIHMAVVVDEYGGTSGIVTLEDILEEIVGDISDEMDEDESTHVALPDGSFIFEGKTLLDDFHKITGVDELSFENVRGDAETLAGLLLEIKGEIPGKNEAIELDDYVFTVISVDNRRIKKVKFVNRSSPK